MHAFSRWVDAQLAAAAPGAILLLIGHNIQRECTALIWAACRESMGKAYLLMPVSWLAGLQSSRA
jgi:hypothetical protein